MSYQDLLNDLFGGEFKNKLSEADFLKQAGVMVFKKPSLLNKRNLEILFKRYGLYGYAEHFYKEIAVDYNISNERVRQILSRHQRILKHPARKICFTENRQFSMQLFKDIGNPMLALSSGTYACLFRNDINTIEDLKKFSDSELLRIPNFTSALLNEVKNFLILN